MARKRQKIVKRVRPLVMVMLSNRAAMQAILDVTRDWGWDFQLIEMTFGAVPDKPYPAGGIVDCLPEAEQVRKLLAHGAPVVRLGTLPHPQDRRIPVVLPDQGTAGLLAAEHFAERGFKNVAYIGYDPQDPEATTHKMYMEFQKRAGECGMTCHLNRTRYTVRIAPGQSPEAQYRQRAEQFGKWLAALPKPVGIFTFNDILAAQICDFCRRDGLAVPDRVAVLGYGNDAIFCEMSPVRLSSVDPAYDEQARQGALLLRRLMNGEAAPAAPTMIPARGVVARLSTDVLAVPDPTVADAMRFMFDHLEQNMSVDDIAGHVGISRRRLERAFRTHLHRGVNAELRRRRLERVCELLKTTDLKVSEIGPLVGYNSRDFLHTSFCKAYGLSPAKYRRRRV